MSVINKKEFFILWTKQMIRNSVEKFKGVCENQLARELLRENGHFLSAMHFVREYGESKVNTQLLTSPIFMLDFLCVQNSKEFYPKDTMDFSSFHSGYQVPNQNEMSSFISNEQKQGMTSKIFDFNLSQHNLDSQQREIFEHLLYLIKAFFKKRMLDGKNLFKVLSKCSEQEDIRWKVYELIFVVSFFCKDTPSDLDFYYIKERSLNIFNNAFNSLHVECNPMLTKCVFQIIGDALKQFTLYDIDPCMPFLCSEEIFMKKAHKINLNENSFIETYQQPTNRGSFTESKTKNDNSSRKPTSFINTQEEENKVLTTQPSMHWKDLSIDTFNLTPNASPQTTPREDDLALGKNSKEVTCGPLNTINSARDEEETFMKIEELENKIFVLTLENEAFKKSLDHIEDSLAKAKEKEEDMESELSDKTQELNSTLIELKELRFKVKTLTKSNEQLENQVAKMREQNKKQGGEIEESSQFKVMCQKLESEVSFLRQSLQEAQSSSDQTLRKIKEKYNVLKQINLTQEQERSVLERSLVLYQN